MSSTKRGHRAESPHAAAARDAIPTGRGFPIVGVGASAGGLEAFSELLRRIPLGTGIAFVLVQHLDPTHQSLLTEALRRSTSLPIEEIRDGVRVEPDHVYVIPPNADVGLVHGALAVLTRQPDAKRPFLPIDNFLRSLAEDRRNQAIGVVLTGMGSDGTAGLRAIQEADGFTFAEEPTTAKFAGMPEAAVRAGVADVVLPIPKLADELLRLARHPYAHAAPEEPEAEADVDVDVDVSADANADANADAGELPELRKVILLIRSTLGADFSDYKTPSLLRRIARRMALRTLPTMGDYVRLLQEDRAELDALFEDLLIQVTSFFRDAPALERLEETAFAAILAAKREGAPIRLWVAGCSTGEEVYSLAILLLELLAEREGPVRRPFQIFGTDVSERAIAAARAGIYPETIAQDVSAERLSRHFEQLEGGRYRIAKHVRERCAFARHDLARDPPFSKIDLVSCRNVLIYFNQALQQRVLASFHFALGLPGFLLLGRTETILEGSALFTAADRETKLFARTATRSTIHPAPTRDPPSVPGRASALAAPPHAPIDVARRSDALLLEAYSPPGVLVTGRGEIVTFRGRTAPYLEPAPGQPRHDVFKMAGQGLLADLRIGLARARETRAKVRREGLEVRADGVVRRFDLVVLPVAFEPDVAESLFLVLFEARGAAAPSSAHAELAGKGAKGAKARARVGRPHEAAQVEQLAKELRAAKEYLQTVIGEHERTNEDLHASNEELLASNEELQSLNEELATAKEELQSTNEELTTLNEELQARNGELAAVSGDIVNILASVEVPVIMVDGARRIRRFTPKARTLLNLLPSDVGRPIGDIRPNLVIDSLDRQIEEVTESLEPRTSEVQDRLGHWYRLQIRPYTTVDRRVDGAVLSLVDIDGLKRAIVSAELARDFATSTLAALQTPLLLLDDALHVISANDAYYETFRVPSGETERRSVFEIAAGAWDGPRLREALAATAAGDGHFRRLELELELPAVGVRSLSLSARRVSSPAGATMVLLALEDVTERRAAEQERVRLLDEAEAARATAEQANRAKDLFLATLSHELRTPLTSLLLQAQLLSRPNLDPTRLQRVSEVIQRAARAQAQLIDDLLDVSRIVAGKLKMQPEAVSLGALVHAALELVEPTAHKKGIALFTALDETLPPVWVDPLRLRQAVWNLLTNAVKFTPAQGSIRVSLEAVEGRARLRVADTGSGIEASFLPRIFERFSQELQSTSLGHGGLGLGLAIARYVVVAAGGTLSAESEGPGKGATFTLTLAFMPSDSALVPARLSPVPGLRALRGAQVLLVDDDDLTREALVESLEVNGAEVRAAQSAAQAMALFEAQAPEVVVCDLAMPDEDGYALLERIRARGPLHGGDVPAVALTALATDEDRARAIAAGFQLHLAKPVEVERLVAAIARVSHGRVERRSSP